VTRFAWPGPWWSSSRHRGRPAVVARAAERLDMPQPHCAWPIPETRAWIESQPAGRIGRPEDVANAISSRGFQAVVNIDLIGTFNVLRAGGGHRSGDAHAGARRGSAGIRVNSLSPGPGRGRRGHAALGAH